MHANANSIDSNATAGTTLHRNCQKIGVEKILIMSNRFYFATKIHRVYELNVKKMIRFG